MGEVFTIYSENERMSAEGLLKFLHTEQGDVDFTLDDAKQIMERIRKDWKKSFGLASINSDLSKEAFRKYLMNPDLNGVLHNVVSHFSCFSHLPSCELPNLSCPGDEYESILAVVISVFFLQICVMRGWLIGDRHLGFAGSPRHDAADVALLHIHGP